MGYPPGVQFHQAATMFRPFTVCQVVASDSGRIVILEYDGTKNMSNSQQWMDGVSVDGLFWWCFFFVSDFGVRWGLEMEWMLEGFQ